MTCGDSAGSWFRLLGSWPSDPSTRGSRSEPLSLFRRRGRRRGGAGLNVDRGKDAGGPARQPPVPIAEELHGRRDEDHADDGGIDEDGDREAHAEELDRAFVAEDEAGEN